MVVVVGVGHLPPVKCPHHLSKLNVPSWSLAPLVKAHAKLPIQILAAYPYLAAGYRNGDHCDMRVCGWYRQFSVGLNQGGK